MMEENGILYKAIEAIDAAGHGAAVDKLLIQCLPVVMTALLVIALIYMLPRYFFEGYTGRYFLSTHRHERGGELHAAGERGRMLRAAAWVLLMFVASRALWLGALQLYLNAQGYAVLGVDTYDRYINRWDAVNYTRIAQYWYGFEDHGIDGYIKEYTIAFLPGFPLMIKALNSLVGDYVISGMILSNAMTIGSGLLFYSLVADMYGESTARRCVFFFMFSIGAGVFSATHSESALLFLTLLAVWLARRRLFVLAVAVGAYASFTRQFGMFVAVPVFYEMLRSLERYPTGHEMLLRERAELCDNGRRAPLMACIRRSVRLRRVAPYFLMAACVLIGYAAYMVINWQIYGTPTAFLYYQKHNWGNSLAPVWVSARTSAEYMLRYLRGGTTYVSVMGIFAPQVALALLLSLMLCMFVRRGNAGDNAYAWCYIALMFSSTWLISGLRYASAMYPVYIMLALLSNRRWLRYVLYAATIGLFLYYNVMYSVNGMVV